MDKPRLKEIRPPNQPLPPPPRLRPPRLLLLLTLTRTIKTIALVGLAITTIGEIRPCGGFSMMPTLNYSGDLLLTCVWPYWSPAWMGFKREVRRGDIVTAASPTNPWDTVCKRVIGVAGDIIEVDPRRGEGMLYSADPEGKLKTTPTSLTGRGWVKIPKGRVWLAGDNTSNSTDSRDYGPVPLALIRGKVIARVWPMPWKRLNGGAQEIK